MGLCIGLTVACIVVSKVGDVQSSSSAEGALEKTEKNSRHPYPYPYQSKRLFTLYDTYASFP